MSWGLQTRNATICSLSKKSLIYIPLRHCIIQYPALAHLRYLCLPLQCHIGARRLRDKAARGLAKAHGLRLRAPSPGARRTRSARRSRRVGRCDLCACPAVEWPRLSSPGGSSAASAAVSAAPPSVVTGGTAQPKPGAVSCPQRVHAIAPDRLGAWDVAHAGVDF